MGDVAVILPAAGRSTRFGDPKQKKIFADLDGRAVWLRAVEPFINRDDVSETIVVIAPEDAELFERRFRANVAFLGIKLVEGGNDRAESVARGLAAVGPDAKFIAIHDAARPCVTTELIDAVFQAARDHGAAIPAVPVADTIKRAANDRSIAETVPRAGLYLAQTPQVFARDLLERAYDARGALHEAPTDDARLVEALGQPVALVDGSPFNLKITTGPDLRLASAMLKAMPRPKRAGPAHPFADESTMWGGPNLK